LSGQVIVDHFDDSILSQIGVSIAGIAIMCLAAYAAAWFKVSGPRVTERTPISSKVDA
jgi:ABC-type glycerol-3-phosphate transport system permease component